MNPESQQTDRLALYRADPAQLMVDSGLTPDPWQAEFLRSHDPRNLMLCARQVGKSLVLSFLALHEILTRPGVTVIIIAQRQDQAAELLRKSVAAFYRIGAPATVLREGTTQFELSTGSRILALPGEERAVHGHTADLLIIDEAARVPDEVFFAASPQLSVSKGKLVALSTAFTKSGWFYEEWDKGQNYKRWSIEASQCPRHTPEFLRQERRQMGKRWFEASYLNIFGDDIAAVFSMDEVLRSVTDDVKPLFPQRGCAAFDEPEDDGPKPLFVGRLGGTP